MDVTSASSAVASHRLSSSSLFIYIFPPCSHQYRLRPQMAVLMETYPAFIYCLDVHSVIVLQIPPWPENATSSRRILELFASK